MMKNVPGSLLLLLVINVTLDAEKIGLRPPGKPVLTMCRSPEKETFTCWWEPGSDGGLPTTYALYYTKENSDAVFECPDYHTAGKNSCFFNKNDTSLWVNYNITVVATNTLGRTFSDPMDIDVVYIVKPNPPEELNVTVMEDKSWPFLRASWESPDKADTRSGWITLIYELRVKLEDDGEWEMHLAGQQKVFNIFSLRSGGTYQVQVRCKPDHGFWSEWSSTSYIKVPDYFHREKSMWILVTVFAAFIFLIAAWLIHMNGHSLKHCILPPVPGPKIKGFDKKLLKYGNSEEILTALVVPGFPPTTSSTCDDLLVEYLEVYIPEDQEMILEESKAEGDLLKSEALRSDNDSGRGSCDSHTLLMEKCAQVKETDIGENPVMKEKQRHQQEWNESPLAYAHKDLLSPDMSGGRVKTWPSVFSPLPQQSAATLSQTNPLVMAKQHCHSDSLFPLGSTSSYFNHTAHSTEEAHRHSEFYTTNNHPQKLQARSDLNISNIGYSETPTSLQLPPMQPTSYVEVQEVNRDNMVLLQPAVSKGCCGDGRIDNREDYSKVKGMSSDKVLLLQRDVVSHEMDLSKEQKINGALEADSSSPQVSTVSPAQNKMSPTVDGYVDTAVMFTLPTH